MCLEPVKVRHEEPEGYFRIENSGKYTAQSFTVTSLAWLFKLSTSKKCLSLNGVKFIPHHRVVTFFVVQWDH